MHHNLKLEPQIVYKKEQQEPNGGNMPEEDERAADLLKESIALRKNGDTERALKVLDMLIKQNPQSAAARREKAITLQMMGEKDLAMNEYKKAVQIDPAFRMRKLVVEKRDEKWKNNSIVTGQFVSDIMAKDLISVPLGATAKDVSELMLKKNISSVVVKEGTDIIGIVTERDFVRNHHYISGKDFTAIPVKDLAAYPLITIPANTPLEIASNQMAEQGIRHLLVREGDDIVGLISLRDILQAYSRHR